MVLAKFTARTSCEDSIAANSLAQLTTLACPARQTRFHGNHTSCAIHALFTIISSHTEE
ncbi:MAG TPA: hypothetical protein VHA37_05595 [Candidatus Saccharimonadales bacterium]|nr:hypothetical protein [Candidatus Saccharimonadales bacterium]